MRSVIIVCAGNSSRFSGGRENKTLYLFEGKPVFLYSVEAFEKFGFDDITVVVKEEEREAFEKFSTSHNFKIIKGGLRRQDSVLNALKELPYDCEVLIHDGARPFVTKDLIKNVLSEIKHGRCVVPAIKSEDTIRIEVDGKYKLFDRNKVFRMQTPQGCIAGEIKELYEKFSNLDLLDDASAFEIEGREVKLIEGEKRNIKITTREDINLLRTFMN